jgi:hypothetical protein
MSRPKPGKPEEVQGRIEEPALLRGALQHLFDEETEFPIRVEGTQTLPYFATLQAMEWNENRLVLKLVRPLPHELLVGAVFHFLCTAGEQRYEGFLTYQGRQGYLQYDFEAPAFLTLSDRRVHRRYPFRPRESAYVILQDAGIPGIGVAGPLVNIGLGGLAMRVDRILRLDTGVRVPPSTALFERGKGFTRVRIQDLPRLHVLETRGMAAHAQDRGTEVILGIQFTTLEPAQEDALRGALEFRELLMHGSGGIRPEGGPMERREGEAKTPQSVEEVVPVDTWALQRSLRRRSALVALVAPPGEVRMAQEVRLRESGFLRLMVASSLEELLRRASAEPRSQPPRLVLVELGVAHAGDSEPLEAVRTIEAALAPLGGSALVILTEAVDPTLLLSQAEGTHFLHPDLAEETILLLDDLLEGVQPS